MKMPPNARAKHLDQNEHKFHAERKRRKQGKARAIVTMPNMCVEMVVSENFTHEQRESLPPVREDDNWL
jgi:hypothetical protein